MLKEENLQMLFKIYLIAFHIILLNLLEIESENLFLSPLQKNKIYETYLL